AVALADAAQGAGVELVRNAEVTALLSTECRAGGVRLAGGEVIEGDAVVLAAGAWARQVEGLPRELPVWPVRGQMLRLIPREPLPWTLVCGHDGRYLVPRANNTLLVGSTMEDVGFDDRVTEEGRETLAEGAAVLIPALEQATVVEAWAGFRPMSADQWPILGPDPEMAGLFYAAGHGRNGVLYASLVGRSVAELVLNGHTEVEWEPFGIQRFLQE
ncbi:MAG: FAD-dependent oxidoreductase, partial [Longimicrobiales bacterium]